MHTTLYSATPIMFKTNINKITILKKHHLALFIASVIIRIKKNNYKKNWKVLLSPRPFCYLKVVSNLRESYIRFGSKIIEIAPYIGIVICSTTILDFKLLHKLISNYSCV